VVAAVCVFAVAYRFHSAWLLAKVLTLDELRATPAVVHEDGKDFVRTNRWVVFRATISRPSPDRGRWLGRCWRRSSGYLPGDAVDLVGATLAARCTIR